MTKVVEEIKLFVDTYKKKPVPVKEYKKLQQISNYLNFLCNNPKKITCLPEYNLMRTTLLQEIVQIQHDLVSENIANEIGSLMEFSDGEFKGANIVEDK